MKSKLFVLILFTVGLLILSACSADDVGDKTTPESSSEQTENETVTETLPATDLPETEAETLPENDNELLVSDSVLNSIDASPLMITPPLNDDISYPYAKIFKTKAELAEYTEYAEKNFDLDTPHLEWEVMVYGPIAGTYTDTAAEYNSAYFKDYALIMAVVEVPGAMGYLPKVESVDCKDNEINVVITTDPYDNIKTNVYHIFISVPADKYTENVNIIHNQKEKSDNGTPVSVPFEYQVGGEIQYDIEFIGYAPQYSHTIKAFDTKEKFDEYLNTRKFGGYIKNDTVGTTFIEKSAKYDSSYFNDKALIILGETTMHGTVPEITSVTIDDNKLRIGYAAASNLLDRHYTYICYTFIEIPKSYNIGQIKELASGYDVRYIAEPTLNTDDEKITINDFKYQSAMIIDGEKFGGPDRAAYAVTSQAQLQELVELRTFNGEITCDILPKSFVDTANEYTEEFFKDKMLIMIRARSEAGVVPTVNTVTKTGFVISIDLSPNPFYLETESEKYAYYMFLELPAEYYESWYDYYFTW